MRTKGRKLTLVLIIMLLIGMSLTLGLFIRGFLNSVAIVNYSSEVSKITKEECLRLLNEAEQYNSLFINRENQYSLPDEQKNEHKSMLKIDDGRVMGYVEVPSVKAFFPIYRGTDNLILQPITKHLEWTSLPTGGKNSYAVVSDKKTLLNPMPFHVLDKVSIGDTIIVRVLNKTMIYEVDQKKTLYTPQATELLVEKDQDLFALVSNINFGDNSKRLMLRGHRVQTEADANDALVIPEAIRIEPLVLMPMAAIPILLIWLIVLAFGSKKNYEDEEG